MNFLGLSRYVSGAIVSIHIRHCWRMNYHDQPRNRGASCFNPHSPLLANEFGLMMLLIAERSVSIHIRHCWRMNCGPAYELHLHGIVSIHIRHCWRMNCGGRWVLTVRKMFQSTFAIAGE